MNQSILVNTDVDEGSKFRDIHDNSVKHHTLPDLLELGDLRIETDLFKLGARVASWLFQFGYDIAQGW